MKFPEISGIKLPILWPVEVVNHIINRPSNLLMVRRPLVSILVFGFLSIEFFLVLIHLEDAEDGGPEPIFDAALGSSDCLDSVDFFCCQADFDFRRFCLGSFHF